MISDGVDVLALRTPTLPPATHTNTYLVGKRRFVIVDPATPHEDERDRLRTAVAERQRQGHRPAAIFLTHHHPDHVGFAAALARELAIPVGPPEQR